MPGTGCFRPAFAGLVSDTDRLEEVAGSACEIAVDGADSDKTRGCDEDSEITSEERCESCVKKQRAGLAPDKRCERHWWAQEFMDEPDGWQCRQQVRDT